jgi:hypothetical protein
LLVNGEGALLAAALDLGGELLALFFVDHAAVGCDP